MANRTNRKRNSIQLEVRNARHWRRLARIWHRSAFGKLYGENPTVLIRRLPFWQRVFGFLRQRWTYAALVIFAFALGPAANAQQLELPDAPQPQLHRVTDSKFLLAESALAASLAFDGVTTVRGLAHGCFEENPLLGMHPSSRSVGLFLGAQFAAGTIFNYAMKRRTRGKVEGWAWQLPSWFLTGEHTIAAAGNIAVGCS